MDAELVAMQKLTELLSGLDEAQRERVLRWAAARYLTDVLRPEEIPQSARGLERTNGPAQRFSDFAELFHAVDPADSSERALAASYWLSEQDDGEPFTAQSAN